MQEARFIEIIVAESNLNRIEEKIESLGLFLVAKTIFPGMVVNFNGINLKIDRIEPADAVKITNNTEISITVLNGNHIEQFRKY